VRALLPLLAVGLLACHHLLDFSGTPGGAGDARQADRSPGGEAGREVTAPQPLTPLAPDDGRLWVAETDRLRLLTYLAASDTFREEQQVPRPDGRVVWIAPLLSGPLDELVALKVDRQPAPRLELWRWSGGTWTLVNTRLTGDLDKRDFDLATDGETVLLVSGDGGPRPLLTRLSGPSSISADPLPINDGGDSGPDLSNGAVLWVQLVAAPGSPGEATLLFADANADLVAVPWSKGAWDVSRATLLGSQLKTNVTTGVVSNRAFDGAYESSGALLVAWGRASSTSDYGFAWRRRPAGGTWSTVAKVPAPATGLTHALDLAAEPGGDRIAGAFFDLGDSVERLGLATWNGAAWVGGELDGQTRDVNDTATGDMPGGVAWCASGPLAVYADDTPGKIDWASWADAAWKVQPDVDVPGKGLTESAQLERLPSRDAALVVLSDDQRRLFHARFDGSWSIGPAPLSSQLSSTVTVPFALAIQR